MKLDLKVIDTRQTSPSSLGGARMLDRSMLRGSELRCGLLYKKTGQGGLGWNCKQWSWENLGIWTETRGGTQPGIAGPGVFRSSDIQIIDYRKFKQELTCWYLSSTHRPSAVSPCVKIPLSTLLYSLWERVNWVPWIIHKVAQSRVAECQIIKEIVQVINQMRRLKMNCLGVLCTTRNSAETLQNIYQGPRARRVKQTNTWVFTK